MEKKTQTESFNYHDKITGAKKKKKKKKEQGNSEEITHLLLIEIVMFIIC